MRLEDLTSVVQIEREAFTSPWQKDTFAGLIDRPTVEMLVLEDSVEGVVGYAVLWCVLDEGELANLAVRPRFRGRGLGRKLLEEVIAVARGRGIAKMYLEVRVSNQLAAGLYRSVGFTDVGTRRAYYDQPREDARIMVAKL